MKKLAKIGFWLTISVPVLYFLYVLLLGCTSTYAPGLPDFASQLSNKISNPDFSQSSLFIIAFSGLLFSIVSLFKKEPLKKNGVLSILSLLLSIFILFAVFVGSASINTARMKPPPSGMTKTLFREIQKDIKELKNESFLPSVSCVGENSIFDKGLARISVDTIQRLTGGTPHCISTTGAWAISVNIENKGGLMCIQRETLCTDSTGYIGLSKSEVNGPKCN